MFLVSFSLSTELVKHVRLSVSLGGAIRYFWAKHLNIPSMRLDPWGVPLVKWPAVKTIHEPRQAAQPSRRLETGIRTCRDWWLQYAATCCNHRLVDSFFPYAPTACYRTWDVSMTSTEFASSGPCDCSWHLPLLPCRPCMSMISTFIHVYIYIYI